MPCMLTHTKESLVLTVCCKPALFLRSCLSVVAVFVQHTQSARPCVLSMCMPPVLCVAEIRKIVEAATQNNFNDMSMQGMDQCL